MATRRRPAEARKLDEIAAAKDEADEPGRSGGRATSRRQGDPLPAGDPIEDEPAIADAGEETGDEAVESLSTLDLAAPAAPGALAPTGERGVVLYDPLRRYLAELRQFHPLTAEEEHDLAVRHQQTGDREAAYRLITSHLRLVVRIAFEFKRSWLNLLDLIQEGNLGLLLAIRKFDPYRGIRLSTYAAWWVRAYIIKFLLDNWRMVRVGTTNARRRLLFNLRKEKEALQARGIVPSTKLLAERLDVSEADVIDVDRSLGVSDVSLDAPTGGDSERRLIDTMASSEAPVDEQVAERERREILGRKLGEFASRLDARDRAVFRERMLSEEPATLEVLGKRFGLTREGLRQVEKRILDRLRRFLASEIKDLAALDLVPKGRAPRPVETRAKAKRAATDRAPALGATTPQAKASAKGKAATKVPAEAQAKAPAKPQAKGQNRTTASKSRPGMAKRIATGANSRPRG